MEMEVKLPIHKVSKHIFIRFSVQKNLYIKISLLIYKDTLYISRLFRPKRISQWLLPCWHFFSYRISNKKSFHCWKKTKVVIKSRTDKKQKTFCQIWKNYFEKLVKNECKHTKFLAASSLAIVRISNFPYSSDSSIESDNWDTLSRAEDWKLCSCWIVFSLLSYLAGEWLTVWIGDVTRVFVTEDVQNKKVLREASSLTNSCTALLVR